MAAVCAHSQELIAKKGAVDALAAALAHMSGSTEIKSRSIMSSAPGFQAFQLTVKDPMWTKTFALVAAHSLFSYRQLEPP